MQPDRQRVAALLEQVTAMELSGAAKPGHPDHWRRTEVMDELQDAVGLNGKMVTDRDILKRAERILAEG
jgi:hypothetical protein